MINQEIILYVGIILTSLLFLLWIRKVYINFLKRRKGEVYEELVASIYEERGYKVIRNGLEKGVEDEGIDVIASKSNETLLIQCKNWAGENRIFAKDIKEFYGNCNFFIDKYKLKREEVICIYTVPRKSLFNFSAQKLFKLHYKKCRYEVIEI